MPDQRSAATLGACARCGGKLDFSLDGQVQPVCYACSKAPLVAEKPEEGACAWCGRPMRSHPLESCIGEPWGVPS